MPGCAAVGCNNRSEKGYTMKCFPRNPLLRKIWKDKVSRADWEPSNNSFLCHVHFEADQWTIARSGVIKLKKNAIPSIFTETSKRKSLKKRRKLIDASEEENPYIIKYLKNSTSNKISLQNTLYNQYTTNNVTTLLSPSAYTGSTYRTATEIITEDKKICDTIAISDESSKSLNFLVEKEFSIKEEMKSNEEPELDDLEEKLRSICDGDDKDIRQDCEQKSNVIDTKINQESRAETESQFVVPCMMNDKVSINNHDEDKKGGTIKLKVENENETQVHDSYGLNNSANGETSSKSDTHKRSTFTIKLTGIDEDVTEIVEGLGTEPIVKYECSNEVSNGGDKTYVTSVISVTDTFSHDLESQDVKPKVEIWSQDEQTDKFQMKLDEREENFSKLTMGSPGEVEYAMDYGQLRKKIKFQEEIIRKLKNHWKTNREPESTKNHVNTRSQAKRQKIEKECNGDCRKYESREKYVNDLSSRLRDSNETVKRLTSSLNEANVELKKCQLFLRQRDNRIKELNWKLNKASKYIERAEKNANNYRKKMMSMQNLLSKKKLEPVNAERLKTDGATCSFIQQPTHTMIIPPTAEQLDDKQCHIQNERIICKTVQDIFEESNHCDDDDSIIDNPEDFMRQFAGSL